MLFHTLSSPFSIESGEKVNIILEFRGFNSDMGGCYTLFHGPSHEHIVKSWVECDNIESHRNNFKIITSYKGLKEQLEKDFSFMNP